jgi:MFS family permease
MVAFIPKLTVYAVVWLFVGRLFQCITSNALWIIGMATMAENLGTEHMGKIAGLTSTLTAAGTTAGPVLAGLLFEAGGYWCAWAGAAAFLLVDIIMRLFMIEKPVKLRRAVEVQEREPLLQNGSPTVAGEQSDRSIPSELKGWRFHICLLREPRFSAGIFCAYVFAVLIGCFESTLAVHVRSAFGWRALHVGLLFTLIQGPGMMLAAPVGWMKDRIGSRTPTAVGFFALVPFVVVLGIPGDNLFSWAKDEALEKIVYVGCMAAIGCLLSLLNGAGSIEATGE